MLDWSKIDNEKKFQRLLNHLFALECNSPGFIPSSPYIGADGGWDGYHNGSYSRENKSGLWSIQAKWTKKSFSDALPNLKHVIKDELRKSKKNHVNYLRLGTNAELKVEQVRELEELNNGEVDDFFVWHRENLTMRIELQPFLRYYFFGEPQFPMLRPSNLYFNQVEKHVLNISIPTIERLNEYKNDAKDFIVSKEKSILIIRSISGYGKSHFMRDISLIAPQIDPDRQTWVITPAFRNIQDMIQDELIDNRRYLLLFDDADRYMNLLKPIISYIKHEKDRVKIILSCRTSGYNNIYDLIKELKCEEIYKDIHITDWSKNELIKLLRFVVNKNIVRDEDIIVSLYPNPYLIVCARV